MPFSLYTCPQPHFNVEQISITEDPNCRENFAGAARSPRNAIANSDLSQVTEFRDTNKQGALAESQKCSLTSFPGGLLIAKATALLSRTAI